MKSNKNWSSPLEDLPGSGAEAAVTAYAAEGGDGDFEQLFQQAPQPMWLYDLVTLKFLHVNQAAIDQYGYSRSEFLSMAIKDIRPREDVDRLHTRILSQRARGGRYDNEVSTYWRHVCKNGETIWVDIHSQISRYKGRDAALIVAVNVTERKQTQERLDLQRAYFRQLFDSASDAILLLDRSGTIADANQNFLKLFQYELQEVLGAQVEDLIVPDARRNEVVQHWETIDESGSLYRETRRMRKDGTLLDIAVAGYPIVLQSKRYGTYLIYKDLTEKKQLLKKVRYHSTHSATTGLINRSELERRLQILGGKSRPSKRAHAVLHVALDQFMLVSRTCGHAAATKLLRQVVGCMRDAIGPARIAHLYADEFCILLSGTSHGDLADIARRIIDDIGAITFRWDGLVYKIGANVGGIVVPPSSNADQAILPMAEMACEVAREKGANKLHIAEIGDEETGRRHHEVHRLSQIHEALDSDRFVLHAQRIVSVTGVEGQHGYEVLVRMLDRDGDLVSPGHFIPVAERFRLMGQIDRWLLKKLFEMLDNMARQNISINGRVSVNLSGETLSEDELSDYIKLQFERYHVAPENLCFEITETAAIQNIAAASRFVSEMQAMGATIALDDFGSGMSSFKYLRELPIDYLKIDGLFIRDIIANDADRAMTQAISRMAQALGIRTIAECVETHEILDCVRELGVDYVQGFALHRPEPLTVEMLRS
ncbi:MAG TPA: EAL domain-containing protein [Gammaproteobacteria bacterium]|nr:EAL domain-containing protein [Gammaproteobacteria bacterium]